MSKSRIKSAISKGTYIYCLMKSMMLDSNGKGKYYDLTQYNNDTVPKYIIYHDVFLIKFSTFFLQHHQEYPVVKKFIYYKIDIYSSHVVWTTSSVNKTNNYKTGQLESNRK